MNVSDAKSICIPNLNKQTYLKINWDIFMGSRSKELIKYMRFINCVDTDDEIFQQRLPVL